MGRLQPGRKTPSANEGPRQGLQPRECVTHHDVDEALRMLSVRREWLQLHGADDSSEDVYFKLVRMYLGRRRQIAMQALDAQATT